MKGLRLAFKQAEKYILNIEGEVIDDLTVVKQRFIKEAKGGDLYGYHLFECITDDGDVLTLTMDELKNYKSGENINE